MLLAGRAQGAAGPGGGHDAGLDAFDPLSGPGDPVGLGGRDDEHPSASAHTRSPGRISTPDTVSGSPTATSRTRSLPVRMKRPRLNSG